MITIEEIKQVFAQQIADGSATLRYLVVDNDNIAQVLEVSATSDDATLVETFSSLSVAGLKGRLPVMHHRTL